MNSPFGALTLFEENGALVALEFGQVPGGEPSPLLQKAQDQLTQYFDGRLQAFDLPLNPHGTDFQKRVWQAMTSIPYGQTQSYGDIAKALNSGARPVGTACGRNPLPIVIPCHRILAKDGRIGGYSGGDGPETKKALLRLENASFVG